MRRVLEVARDGEVVRADDFGTDDQEGDG